MTTATAPSAAPLTAVDRCDRCGAQAYLRVQLKSGGELLFCAHHAREHSDKLREVAEHVQDETGKLADSPSSSDRLTPTTPDPRPRSLVDRGLGHLPGRSSERVAAMSGLEYAVALAIAIGVVGVIVPLLPGSLLVLGAILVWAWDIGSPTGWAVLAVATLVIALGSVVKYVVPGRRLKDNGIPNSTLFLGGALGVVGFFVIPVVGLLIGFVLGVYLAELRRVGGQGRLARDLARAEGGRAVDADRVHRLPARCGRLGRRRRGHLARRGGLEHGHRPPGARCRGRLRALRLHRRRRVPSYVGLAGRPDRLPGRRHRHRRPGPGPAR